METNRLQLLDWLKNHFEYIRDNQPYQQKQLLDSIEVFASQNNMPIEYHVLSLRDIMEVANKSLK